MNVIIADNQGITQAGLIYVLNQLETTQIKIVMDKAGLAYQLKETPAAIVILDYTLFDFNDIEELMIIGQRFRDAFLVLFSEDLSIDFAKNVIAMSSQVSIIMKESPLTEIRQCLSQAFRHQRYICQRMAEMLLAPPVVEEITNLTKTETEILKDIALGMTTKEIAEKRISSFHTVNTHRKNIFRKLGVNSVHEATKYAFRAGLVDSAEYYI